MRSAGRRSRAGLRTTVLRVVVGYRASVPTRTTSRREIVQTGGSPGARIALLAASVALAALVAPAWPGAVASEGAAEALLFGRFVTLDPARPQAEALALRGGRIVFVGSREDAARLGGPKTRRVDVPGIAFPGFADAHVHAAGLGDQLESLDLRGLTKAEVLARVGAAARTVPSGEWIRGGGWDQGFWTPATFPTAEELDGASPDHPVALDRIDGHSVWLNTRALRAAGVDRDTPERPGGRILRESDGTPSGILVDTAMEILGPALPKVAPAQAERRLRKALDQYVRWGVTSVHDAGVDKKGIDLYRKLLAERALPLRIYVMAQGDRETVQEILLRGPEIGQGEGRLTVRSFKVGARRRPRLAWRAARRALCRRSIRARARDLFRCRSP